MEYLATPLDSNTPSPSELNGHKFNSLLPNISNHKFNSLLPNISNSKHSDVLVKHHKARLQHDIGVVPPQSWGDRSDTKHLKCLLLGGRWLNQLTLIPKPKGSGSARVATAQVGPANKRNDTKRCLPIEASLRPGEAIPW